MALDTANLAAADSPDLIAAARRDGDALHRELAERLDQAEELADRLGKGDEVVTANLRADAALRRMRSAHAALDASEATVRAMSERLRLAAAQLAAHDVQFSKHRHVEPISARTLLPGAPDLDAGQWAAALRTIDALLSDNDADDSHCFAQAVAQ